MEILADERPDKSQDLEGCVFNVSFDFSEGKILCIGLKYIGGNPSNGRNYRFDHANIWKSENDRPERVPINEALDILRSHHLTLKDVKSYLR